MESLTVLNNNNLAIQGVGASFFQKLLKPGNIRIQQPTSKAEGTVGMLRISETGQEFKEMQLVLLFEPVTRRSLYEGDDFSADNLICFSLDNVAPHKNAKVPQAMECVGCEKGSWARYRETNDRRDIPPCRSYEHLLVVDRITQLPYYLDVRGTSLDKQLQQGYWRGMQNIARLMALAQSQHQNPSVFDFSFTLFTNKVQGKPYYTLGFKDFALIKEEDRAKFGNIYLQFLNHGNNVQEPVIEDEHEYVAPAATVQSNSDEVITI